MSLTSPHHSRHARPAAPSRLARFVRRSAHAASRRPKLTVAAWLALIALCVSLGSLSPTRTLSTAGSGVGQSAHAQARLTAAGLQSPAVENVLVRSASPSQTTTAVDALSRGAARLPSVAAIQTPRSTPALGRAGGATALVAVTLSGDPNHAGDHVAPLQAVVSRLAARMPAVRFAQAGAGSFEHAISGVVSHGLQHAELISIPVTLVILLLAFGAVVAACVPLLLGLSSVAAALGALGLVSQIAPNGSSTAPVVVLIGLAVGVDYSLFYIRRERAERYAGSDARAAMEAAAATTGRAILVAGTTVIIGLAGLLFTGFGVFTSMALGAILVVAIAVLGSLTVLPAVLTLLGDRIDRGRLWRRGSGRRPRRVAGAGWARFAEIVTRRPRAALALASVVLGTLALPVLGMHTANPGVSDLPAATPVVRAEHAIEHWFPGSSKTAELVVTGRRLGTAQTRTQLAALGREGRRLTGGHGAIALRVSRDGRTALVSIPAPFGGLGVAARNVTALRTNLTPAAARMIPRARAQLTGDDAANVDFTQRLSAVTPIVIAFVLGLACLLMVATFRSWWLSLAVIGLNLASVGAAFGLLVVTFQHTWAQSLLGFTSDGAVVNWLPLFAFVVLFGLSMDYTVLVLERAAEARRGGATPRQAAAEAMTATGSTVTSAAVVMVAVFAVFATLPLLEFKQLGVGLAAAIALDATIVRAVALPAALTLLGDRGLPAPAVAGVPRSRRAGGWDHPRHAPQLETSRDH